MRLKYAHDAQGGFIAGDEDEYLAISYAYPTSFYAETARRRPEKVALEMVNKASQFPHPVPHVAELWSRLRRAG